MEMKGRKPLGNGGWGVKENRTQDIRLVLKERRLCQDRVDRRNMSRTVVTGGPLRGPGAWTGGGITVKDNLSWR